MNDNLKRISRDLSYIYQFDKDAHKLYGLSNQIDPEGYDFYVRVEDLDRLLKYKNIDGDLHFIYQHYYNDPIELLTKQQLTYNNDYIKINANNLQIFKSKSKQYFTLNKIDITDIIGGIKGHVKINDKDIELLEKQNEEIAETSIISKFKEIFDFNVDYYRNNEQIDTLYIDYNDSQNWIYKTDHLKNRINLLLELSGYYNKENSKFWQIYKPQNISNKIYNDKCNMYMLFSEYELNHLSKKIYPNSLFKIDDNLCSFVFCGNYDNIIEIIENYKFLIQESKSVLKNSYNKLLPETLSKSKIVKIDLSFYDNKTIKPIWYNTSNPNIIFTNNILHQEIINSYDTRF